MCLLYDIDRFDNLNCALTRLWSDCVIMQADLSLCWVDMPKSEYDREIQLSHTADQPTAPGGRAAEHL